MAALAVLLAMLAAAPPPQPHPRRQARAAPERASPLETPAPPRAARPRGTGAVVYATAARAYLDVGAEDGLREGVALELTRAGAAAGRCVVESVAERQAVCAGAGLRAGDALRFEPAAPPPAPAEAKVLPEPPDAAELERRRAAVAAAPLPLVEFKAASGVAATAPEDGQGGRRRPAEVAFTYAAWAPGGAGSSHEARLDVGLRGAELGGGVLLDVDARAERWLTREAPRFRPRDDTRLYLWQAQLTAGPGSALTGPSLTLAAGRVLPWAIPGATIFDGALAGVRLPAGEVGAFGGLVPQPDTLAPTSQRATGGGYWLLEHALAGGGILRQEGRIAVVRSPELGTRVEGSLTGRAWLHLLDVSAEAHLGGSGKVQAPGLVDAARLDVAARPAPGLALGGSVRYAGLDWPQPYDPAPFPGRTRAADLYASWDATRLVRLGLTGGLSRDAGSGNARRWLGPELALPRLLGPRGGLSLGYLEERGWLGGRSAWAQLGFRPFETLRLLARASWSREQQLGVDRDEVALLASATADLSRHLGLRLALSSRAAPSLSGDRGGSTPYGTSGFATVIATY